MRTHLVGICLFLLLRPLSAGTLDVAVVQFPEEKTTAQLDAALARVDLFKLTDANKTQTSEADLKGGYVLFAQRFPQAAQGAFATTTRLKDDRADVQGRLSNGHIAVEITLRAGLKVGLRNFERRVYSGEGALPPGAPRVISLRRIKGKSTSVLKGQSTVKQYDVTTAVIAQFRP